MNDVLSMKIFSFTLGELIKVLCMWLLCIVVGKVILRIIDRGFSRLKVDPNLQAFLHSAIKLIIWFVIAVIVADSLGIPVTSLVALLSVVGIALSLAVQGLLSNLCGGVLLLTARPFKVGDFVEAGGESGTVVEVGLIYTKLRTVDNKIVFIPNSDISGSKIQNFTRLPLRRVDLTVSASYDDSTAAVKAAVADAIASVEGILPEPEPFVRVLAYGDSAISYTVRVWARSQDYWDVYFGLTEAVRDAFERDGVTMTYNHINVHMVPQEKAPAEE
ncbi:MAG: mechanosensitive ion channel family protein [Clostridia bacterium]|nr:mechanosensitive ion channel family protein [Clostridia bacterium]